MTIKITDYGQPELPDGYDGPTWTTAEMTSEFTALGFAAPYVVVRRKQDGREGMLEFIHRPRVYFDSRGDFQ
jgi:hypothetical protein